MQTPTHIMWIDWGRHPRTHSLSGRLGADLFEIRSGGFWLQRYVRSVLRTCAAVGEKRPDVIIATNPSIVLGYLLIVLRSLYGFRLVADAHYFGVTAASGSRPMQWLLNRYNAAADLVIVTNANHAELLRGRGARTFICEDPLPLIPDTLSARPVDSSKYVLLISSFDVDEPYAEACEAFSTLSEKGYTLLVSGNYKKAQIDPSRFRGVRFLGFLPEDEYYWYLKSVCVVLDLTTLEDCLVCGAYEALALRKPLVLSKTKALADYFGTAAVLTENTATAIGQSVLAAHAQSAELVRKAEEWVSRNDHYMKGRTALLTATLASMSSESWNAGMLPQRKNK